MDKVRVAVVGAGVFGRNHLRVLRESAGAELAGVYDLDPIIAAQAAAEFQCRAFASLESIPGAAEAAIVATPTSSHAAVCSSLLEGSLDVLVEKPITDDLAAAQELIGIAERHGRIFQVGHLERFNPAVEALTGIVSRPLFFEIHRLSIFTPRSLDVDVVLDLMIHDVDILLALTGEMPSEVRACGLPVLSSKVDIANVRLAFPGGCIANLTASRVSTERVRKLRLFQPHQYISLDYHRQECAAFTVSGERQIGYSSLPVEKEEPLRREVESFLSAVRSRQPPRVTGPEAARALEVAFMILAKIEEHLGVVTQALKTQTATAFPAFPSNT